MLPKSGGVTGDGPLLRSGNCAQIQDKSVFPSLGAGVRATLSLFRNFRCNGLVQCSTRGRLCVSTLKYTIPYHSSESEVKWSEVKWREEKRRRRSIPSCPHSSPPPPKKNKKKTNRKQIEQMRSLSVQLRTALHSPCILLSEPTKPCFKASGTSPWNSVIRALDFSDMVAKR